MTKITRRSFLKTSAVGITAMGMLPEETWAKRSQTKFSQKPITTVGQYDVVVVGGGPAGVIAAIAAARGGAKTAIVEKYGFLGGMATAGYVAPISEFAMNNQLYIGGIPWEFIKRLESMGGAFVEMPKGNVDFDIELYKLCMQRMVLESGITMYMHSSLIGCETNGNTVTNITIENKNGLENISSKVFIDCTGDGDLAHLSGVPMQSNLEAELQPLSFCFVLSGVDTKSELMQRYMYHDGKRGSSQCTPVRTKLLELKEQGVDIPDFGGPWFNNVMHEGSVAVNITRQAANSCNNRDYTSAECQLREDIFKFADLLKKHVPEFKDSYVSSTAPQAGIRESRRIKGVHTVTAEEYVSGVKYEDSISRGLHQIDMHASKGSGQVLIKLEQPAYVPYRALIADEFPNLLVAGRCISTDRKALASLRVQASCMGTGQAAGAAAALAVKTNTTVQNIDVPTLIATLKQWGAVI